MQQYLLWHAKFQLAQDAQQLRLNSGATTIHAMPSDVTCFVLHSILNAFGGSVRVSSRFYVESALNSFVIVGLARDQS